MSINARLLRTVSDYLSFNT